VLAVADGTVTYAVDGVPENRPGKMNRLFVPGNAILLEHSSALYSLYAHLRPGTLRVRAGQRVKRGATLGLCGNSGNSSEPHLHFQLQSGPVANESWGIEALFERVRVTRDGSTQERERYSFLKGDRIEQL
jgi:murein DD-endopeptidase MepM/ murein hydrolase activator NlpD